MYDDVAGFVRMGTDAKAVIVVVLDGHFGNGYSIDCEPNANLEELPKLLLRLVDDLARDLLK